MVLIQQSNFEGRRDGGSGSENCEDCVRAVVVAGDQTGEIHRTSGPGPPVGQVLPGRDREFGSVIQSRCLFVATAREVGDTLGHLL